MAERQTLERLVDRQTEDDTFDGTWDDTDFQEVLRGEERIEISNAGGEFKDLAREVFGDFWKPTERQYGRSTRVDHRTRRDRIQRRIDAFNKQMPAMVDAFLDWSNTRAKSKIRGFFGVQSGADLDPDSGSWPVTVVDLFREILQSYSMFIADIMVIDSEIVSIGIKPTDAFLTSALVRQGLVPCSPITPSVAITIDAIEFYRVAHLRNPHFSIQAFVKTLCDLHGTDYQRYLARQFSIAFDLYIQIGGCVDSLVTAALRRDTPDWRLKHACPSCTYVLQDEQSLRLRLLYAMDGNDSLKRILRRAIGMDDDNIGPSSELPTPQQVSGDRYLTREGAEQRGQRRESEDNLCAGRWKNMDDEKTKKAWGIYDETGIFLAVCRHGFSLLLADMVQSGELAKYPLAVVSKLMDAFGEGLGGGYDIGCQFKTTLDNSSLGPRARSLHYTSLVGAFHGHAHRRLCQLDHLTTYIPGLGLEDLETCERTFSKSNGLASSLRYASVFHRQQGILTYFEHNDDYEVYANLSNFLYNNYKQALEILYDGQVTLPKLMQDIGVSDESIFEDWLKEEREYLHGLRSEPQQETLQMEYWQKLVNLAASKDELDTSSSRWSMYTPSSTTSDEATTRRLETTRRHAMEVFEKDLKIVQELESKLEITQRWVPEDAEWQNAAIMVANRKYQRALDNLEGLVVARIFELTKMNRSGTGYKMRKHIAKALQTRSAAIRTALERYNSAARTLSPPRQTLKWEEVVEYAFLADFDLLRNSREDVSQQQWATPTARQATNLYFKMCRAKEEITRLNIEIRRLVTYIRLGDIANLSGFTGSVIPGESILTGVGESTSMPQAILPARLARNQVTEQQHAASSPTEDACMASQDSLDNLEEEEEEEVNVEEASEIFYNILHISTDP
ncbi:hypothetical protein DFH29DRAFT_984896 [Suillus ampliporus]|nr:hypothetical protein DFH29DRAFT_984896 [Suillus ampliporus]